MQRKATRATSWQQGVTRGVFLSVQQRVAWQSMAGHGTEPQSTAGSQFARAGLPVGFPINGSARQSKALHRIALQSIAPHSKAQKNNAASPFTEWGCRVVLTQRKATQRMATHRIESHRKAMQGKATRLAHWQQWAWRGVLLLMAAHGIAINRSKAQRAARQRRAPH